MSSTDYKVISFFSGAMGLDLGLEKAGLNVVWGTDFKKQCVDTIVSNGRIGELFDIKDLTPEYVLEKTGLKIGEAFLVCGGPPCQPFSTAGKRKGINDPRGSLFMDYLRMIKGIRPRFFIMENVKGMLSALIDTSDKTKGCVKDVIIKEFDQIGYKTVYGLLDAVNYGAAQFRERFIVIGSRDKEDIFLPIPSHFQKHQNKEMRWKTLSDVFEGIDYSNDECASLSEERKRIIRMVPEGGNWKSLPVEIQKEAMGGAYESGGGKVGFYRRLSFSEPSPTLVTSPVQKATMLCHPTEDRPLSVKEYARIQGFPDDWVFKGTISDKYLQIGNAVPIPLGKAIGEMFLSVANNSSEINSKRTRGTSVHNRLQKAMSLTKGGDYEL